MPKSATPLEPCIWCNAAHYEPSREHVLPDALGCPPGMTLDTCVCRPCNNALGHVDQALLRAFELQTFVLGIPRKKGRKPTVDSWSWMSGRWTDSGPELHVNAGEPKAEAFGKRLPPGLERTGLFGPSILISDGQAETQFSTPFGDDPRFARAVYKVAFNVLAHFEGAASTAAHNPVRDFVRHGVGSYSVLMLGGMGDPIHHFAPPCRSANNTLPIVPMTILGVDLLADFDPEQSGIARIVEHLEAEAPPEGWALLA